ncbi:Myc-type, basic helix-loop-helix domain-containing protein, partial [Halteromyces radiatus]|uniref:Myc-type, basic helix-loop-helix domain-containing protein n=1 Tax=Halteromyces radiatus TaxID=101107 RepID=UPI002220E2D0
MQQLFEKKRRRRESHNAVERRRRDNINERIFELSTLLPERDAIKNNKGTILRKSVEHIRMLHEEVNKCQHRIQELENMLGMYRIRGGTLNDMNLDMQQQQRPPMMQPSTMNFSTGIQPQLAYRRDG